MNFISWLRRETISQSQKQGRYSQRREAARRCCLLASLMKCLQLAKLVVDKLRTRKQEREILVQRTRRTFLTVDTNSTSNKRLSTTPHFPVEKMLWIRTEYWAAQLKTEITISTHLKEGEIHKHRVPTEGKSTCTTRLLQTSSKALSTSKSCIKAMSIYKLMGLRIPQREIGARRRSTQT